MRNVLKPYGRDAQKIFVRRNTALISCLDNLLPEDIYERQPLVLADRFILLFDGRIDNRSELADLLNIPSSELHSMSDSAIALRLFDRYGERAFEYVIGVFAIIVADVGRGEMLCARDQMGLRVLHYHCSPVRFAVATIPEALFALSGIPRLLNKSKIADTLVERGLNGETTYYQDIKRVLPGFVLRVHESGLTTNQFWYPENIRDVRFKKNDEYVCAFQERLEEAVNSALRSRRQPCAGITGGLDSSSIAVIAADILAGGQNKLETFTAVPELGFSKEDTRGRYFDERTLVRKISELNANIVPHFVPPFNGTIIPRIAELIRISGAPMSGVLNGLWVMDVLEAARSAGYNVMLTGEMGNHTISYDGLTLLPKLLRSGQWYRLYREIVSSSYPWTYLFRHRTAAALVPLPVFRRYKQWRRGGAPPWHDYSAINPELAARTGVIDRAACEYLPFDSPPPRDGMLYRIRTGFNSYCETADWFGRVRANFGIDIRTPAFDRRVVEFCIGIPEDQYLNDGRDRWLIRRAMKGRLPEIVLNNVKTGVQSSDWFTRLARERDSFRKELQRVAQDGEIKSILDLQKLNSIMDGWPDHEPPVSSIEANGLAWALPQALGAAYFVENVTRVRKSDRESPAAPIVSADFSC
jgi:asparagine synthase (glutamine-hydrolysing)